MLRQTRYQGTILSGYVEDYFLDLHISVRVSAATMFAHDSIYRLIPRVHNHSKKIICYFRQTATQTHTQTHIQTKYFGTVVVVVQLSINCRE